MIVNLRRPKAGCAALFLAATFATVPTLAVADTVTLESRDGSAAISGKLLSYSDGRHVIETELGPLTVHAGLVNCIGLACTTPEQIDADVEPHCPNELPSS